MSRPAPYAGSPAPGHGDPTGATGQLGYHEIARAGRAGRGGWWSLLGVVLAIAGFVLASVIVTWGFFLYYAVSGQDASEAVSALVELDDIGSAGILYLLLSISAAIPLTWLAHVAVTGLRPGWLSSVAGRLRWRYLLASLGTSVVALLVAIALGSVLPGTTVTGVEGDGVDITSEVTTILLILVVLVPFQAAAEEYVFRGLLTQSFGSFSGRRNLARALGVLGPALLFALAHGSQSLPIFLDRFSFGVVAGVLVILTGGLEAGIAYHVVNNYAAFGLALFFGNLGDSLDPQGGNGWDVVVTLVRSVVFLLLSVAVARRAGLATTVGRTVLEAPAARV